MLRRQVYFFFNSSTKYDPSHTMKLTVSCLPSVYRDKSWIKKFILFLFFMDIVNSGACAFTRYRRMFS